MKLKKYAYAGMISTAGIIITIVVSHFNIIPMGKQENQTSIASIYLDFSYEEANSDLKSFLALHQINMSNPFRFSSQSDIAQYCNFLNDPKKQALVKFCTSTELTDRLGFLGNIDMVGSPDSPGLVIAALQSNPFFSNYDDVKIVFGSVINDTICQCWDKEKPGGYLNLSSMVDALRDFHLKGKKPDSTTHSVSLAEKHFEIELTTNQSGYLWKLLVAK